MEKRMLNFDEKKEIKKLCSASYAVRLSPTQKLTKLIEFALF